MTERNPYANKRNARVENNNQPSAVNARVNASSEKFIIARILAEGRGLCK
jgi:hypothetical protein